MFELLNEGYHIYNIDESWLSVSDFDRCMWAQRGGPASLGDDVLKHKINIIVAVSNKGDVFLAQTQVNTDDEVMSLFFSKFVQKLTNKHGAGWRDKVVIVLDGASYHRSKETRSCITHLNIKVVLSAPYSYESAPAELWFSLLKRNNFNPQQIKTTKR